MSQICVIKISKFANVAINGLCQLGAAIANSMLVCLRRWYNTMVNGYGRRHNSLIHFIQSNCSLNIIQQSPPNQICSPVSMFSPVAGILCIQGVGNRKCMLFPGCLAHKDDWRIWTNFCILQFQPGHTCTRQCKEASRREKSDIVDFAQNGNVCWK